MPDKKKNLKERPPIIVIMGHIDHGKSTLLDYIRKTNVAEKEAGAITQHISAYEVTHKDGEGRNRTITFLDTPGHEAFKAMRARGASVADIAVLVVSAEDGVKPQTLEALAAIKESEIPFIVAINKIDKPGADVERTKQSLAESEIFIEGYGGAIPAVSISAKTGVGVPALLDMMILVADLEALSGDPAASAEGVVIEANLDTKKGVAGTLIIRNGTLEKGSYIVAGDAFAPVRIMENFLGKSIDAVSFSSPVRIIGWSSAPKVGRTFSTVETKREAEELVRKCVAKEKVATTIDETPSEGVAVIPILLKTDVLGSADAIIHEIKKLETETVLVKVVQSSVGAITENDVKLLRGSAGGIILGFNVKADTRATELAERLGVKIQTFDVIYPLAEWLKGVIVERTPKVSVEEIRGKVKILKVFSQTKDKQVIGGRVEEGNISVDDDVKILRRSNDIGRGKIIELQQQKLKVKTVSSTAECGLLVESKIEIAPGDVIESFVITEK